MQIGNDSPSNPNSSCCLRDMALVLFLFWPFYKIFNHQYKENIKTIQHTTINEGTVHVYWCIGSLAFSLILDSALWCHKMISELSKLSQSTMLHTSTCSINYFYAT